MAAQTKPVGQGHGGRLGSKEASSEPLQDGNVLEFQELEWHQEANRAEALDQ